MEIKVYKCEYTGKLFEKEKDYLKHLRKQKELEEEKKSKKEIQLKSGEIKNSPRLTSTTIEEFWNIEKMKPRVVESGSDYCKGYDEAFKHILEILHNKFVR